MCCLDSGAKVHVRKPRARGLSRSPGPGSSLDPEPGFYVAYSSSLGIKPEPTSRGLG